MFCCGALKFGGTPTAGGGEGGGGGADNGCGKACTT